LIAWVAVFALSGVAWWGLFSLLPAGQGTWRDRPPTRYQGDAVAGVVFTTEGGVQAMCPGVRYAVGCTVGGTIYLPNPCRWRDAYATLACHELGHVNGWSAFHER
jgi:hypothetical protein